MSNLWSFEFGASVQSKLGLLVSIHVRIWKHSRTYLFSKSSKIPFIALQSLQSLGGWPFRPLENPKTL